MKEVVVVGAGFSGLTTAVYLARHGCHVDVFEKSDRAGGLIGTIRAQHGLVETAANGLLNSKLVEDLFNELNLELVGAKAESRKRYIFNSRPRRWPLSFFESMDSIARVGRRFLTGGGFQPQPLESVESWASRVGGSGFANKLLAPALQGIYAGDITQMSANLIYSRIREIRKNRAQAESPKIRGLVAPRDGMGALIEAMHDYLEQKKCKIHFNKEVGELSLSKTPVVLATSAYSAGALKIKMLPLVSVTAFFNPSSDDLDGFGCLFPRNQGVRALGVLINEKIFPGRSIVHSETWIYGGASDEQAIFLNDLSIEKSVIEDRTVLYKKRSEPPIEMIVNRWPEAVPHYDITLEKILTKQPTLPENVFLVGNFLGGIGLGQILNLAKQTADRIAQ